MRDVILGVPSRESWKCPPPPMFFVSAHSKGVAGEKFVSAHSEGLKVAVFSMSWKCLVSADSKRFTGAICLQESKHTGSMHSKGIRRTTWRVSIVRGARRDRADLTKPL